MKKILVINNDFDTMTLLKSWLEKKAYTVRYTGNQQEVSRIVKDFGPDLLLVDVIQKDVVEELNALEETRSVPVLLMTGYALRAQQNQVPVEDTIEKPFNLSLLEKKIEKLVNKK